MIHLYTGDGKGKTTAAIGQAVRAAGNGYRVLFSQFMKGNDTGEIHSLCKLENIKIIRSDKEFGFYSTLSETQKEQLTEIHNRILDELIDFANRETDGFSKMIVLDEITYPLYWKLIDEKRLEKIISYGKKDIEIIMTGRIKDVLSNEEDISLVKAADYITEMKCLRHPFEKGVPARKGIEY